jgi:hypothetical protein
MRGVSECDQGTSKSRPRPTGGLSNHEEKYYLLTYFMPTQYCFVVAVVFCLVGAKHKFDIMFVTNRTLTNDKQWKLMKTDFLTTPVFFSTKIIQR